MSLRKRARFLLPKNPVSSLALPVRWIEKIRSTRIPPYRVPVSALSPEDRAQRLRYWRRTERQNLLLFLGVALVLLYNIVHGDLLGILACIGGTAFIASHWYYAVKMQKILRGERL